VIVVDASVAAKWYLPEPGTEAALELMKDRGRLVAPDLIRLEVLAAITRCVRTGEAPMEETKTRCTNWLRHLEAGVVFLIPESELLEEALRLSVQIKHNLQDCLYLAAARQIEARLTTADRVFRDRAAPFDDRVEMLAGCESH
jgi:predicted nucleic acid-binding protein